MFLSVEIAEITSVSDEETATNGAALFQIDSNGVEL